MAKIAEKIQGIHKNLLLDNKFKNQKVFYISLIIRTGSILDKNPNKDYNIIKIKVEQNIIGSIAIKYLRTFL